MSTANCEKALDEYNSRVHFAQVMSIVCQNSRKAMLTAGAVDRSSLRRDLFGGKHPVQSWEPDTWRSG